MYYIYMLKLRTDRYYTGISYDLEKRLWEHLSGNGPDYTKARRPLELVYFEAADTKSAALMRERQIKDYRQEKKQALIEQLAKEERETIEDINTRVKASLFERAK